MTTMQIFISALFVFLVIPHADSIFGDALSAIIRASALAVGFVSAICLWSV